MAPRIIPSSGSSDVERFSCAGSDIAEEKNIDMFFKHAIRPGRG